MQYELSMSEPIEYERHNANERYTYSNSPLEPQHTHFIFQDKDGQLDDFRSKCE